MGGWVGGRARQALDWQLGDLLARWLGFIACGPVGFLPRFGQPLLRVPMLDLLPAILSDWLVAGTIARGAAETGAVEAYLCARVMRHPTVSPLAGGGRYCRGHAPGGWVLGCLELERALALALAWLHMPACLPLHPALS